MTVKTMKLRHSFHRETTPSTARSSEAAVQKSVCYTLGPVSDPVKLKKITDWLQQQGLAGTTRQTQSDTGAFYNVYLPPLGSSDEAKQEVERLKAMGVRDLSVIWQGVLAGAPAQALLKASW